VWKDSIIREPVPAETITEMVDEGERSNANRVTVKFERILNSDWGLTMLVRKNRKEKEVEN